MNATKTKEQRSIEILHQNNGRKVENKVLTEALQQGDVNVIISTSDSTLTVKPRKRVV